MILLSAVALCATLSTSTLSPDAQVVQTNAVVAYVRLTNTKITKTVSAKWYWKGKLVKTQTLSSGASLRTASVPLLDSSKKKMVGEWTLILKDASGNVRTHHFRVI